MCGIVGAFAFRDHEPGELAATVRPLVARMARRGPDDEGFWHDGRCALGFRRLAILDLTPAGHQPMTTADGRHVMVFNGEIYNFRELRRELEAHGRTFRSTGDAEVLLAALVEWGPAALDRLNGMFALALYDTAEQCLLLARDHAGIKPLHHAITEHGIVFASQYDQILAHPWMAGAAPDPRSTSLYLRFGFVPAPYGLHARAGQVRAGEWLLVQREGRTRRQAYFELPRWSPPELAGDAATDAFEAAFGRAVRRHLESDVPVGVFLSGGIDSPLVAAEARRQHGALNAFTIEVDDPALDEGEDARRYARELGLELVTERITAADALSLLDDVVAAATEPTADYSLFPTLMVSRLARRHVKVALSGDGGDELFWGYPSRFAPAIAQARYFTWPRPARYAAVAARRLGVGAATRDVLDQPSLGRLYQRKHTLLAEPDLAASFPTLAPLPADFAMFEFDSSDPDRAAQWVRWNEYQLHLARVLAKVDRASMHCSLEVRVPLLDREVIDVASRVDWRSCLDLETRTGKRVLRDALARRVAHQTRAKKGFSMPMYDWLVGPLRPLLHELLFEREELMGRAVRRGAIRELDARMRAGARGEAWGLWLLLSLALWERAHGKAGAAPCT